MGGKEERLQVRVDKGLKEWFAKYAAPRGGMSRVLQDYIRNLRKRHGKKVNGQDDASRAGDREAGSGL
jgi:hypothetical protein